MLMPTGSRSRKRKEPAARTESALGHFSGLPFLAAFAFAVVGLAVYTVAELSRQRGAEDAFVPTRWVDLGSRPLPPELRPVSDAPQKELLRVAIAPVMSPEKSYESHQQFVAYLAGRLHRAPKCLQRNSYAEVNDLVRYNRCELAFVCTCTFVRGEREFGMEPLVVPVMGGRTEYHSVVLVAASSPAETLLDLRGKRFASGEILSTSGWLFPAVWLLEHGENPERFLGEHVFTGSHDRSVLAVASGYVDGAAVHSEVYGQMLEEDPSLAVKTRVILQSPPYGMPPFVVSPQIDPTLKEELRTLLLNMHTDAEGKRALASLRIARFILPEPGMYDAVRELSSRWELRK